MSCSPFLPAACCLPHSTQLLMELELRGRAALLTGMNSMGQAMAADVCMGCIHNLLNCCRPWFFLQPNYWVGGALTRSQVGCPVTDPLPCNKICRVLFIHVCLAHPQRLLPSVEGAAEDSSAGDVDADVAAEEARVSLPSLLHAGRPSETMTGFKTLGMLFLYLGSWVCCR